MKRAGFRDVGKTFDTFDFELASPELHVEPWVTLPGRPGEIFMAARGVQPVFFRILDRLKVTQGSPELRGNKVLLGPAARAKLAGSAWATPCSSSASAGQSADCSRPAAAASSSLSWPTSTT